MNSQLKSLRSSFVFLLNYAVNELFPGTILGTCILSETLFRCQFGFNQPAHPDLLPLLEEKIRGLIKQKESLELIAMTPKSAEGYFAYHGQEIRAHEMELSDAQEIPMIRLHDYCDLCWYEPLLQIDLDCACHLMDLQDLGVEECKHWIEITGTAFFSKVHLKAFIKLRKQWLKQKPWQAAERLQLLTLVEKQPILLPKGLELLDQIEHFWRKRLQGLQMMEMKGGNQKLYRLLALQLHAGIYEWEVSYLTGWKVQDHCYLYPSYLNALDLCISSLQFIYETINMLELDANWVLCYQTSDCIRTQQWKQEVKCLTEALQHCGFAYSIDLEKSFNDGHPLIELRVSDSIGERWAGPFLSINLNTSKEDKMHAHSVAAIEYSLLGSTRRLIFLLAELKQGKWPKCLSEKRLNGGEV